MIHARVTITTAICRYTYTTIGRSTFAIDASARELVGDEPCSVTVMVQ